ncbi:MAG: ATP-binding protein [Chryseolinea sp.]
MILNSTETELQNLIKNQQEEIEILRQQLREQITLRKETDDTIKYFATSLFGKNTLDEILWDVAKNCISRLGFVDCVIYLVDESRNVLVQKAAYGAKNPQHFQIQDPIEIPLGLGIVGAVAESGNAEIVNDTRKDPRYIVDDEMRNSEMAVPLILQSKVIGVIDTEHPHVNFFSQHHLNSLTTIAAICASKISQSEADQRAMKALEVQREADHIKQLDQIKSQFFANISHEFRTPLNLILAPLQKDEPLSREEMQMMSRNAKRLLRLVNQLLDLARLESGSLKAELRHINVFGFISDIANAFELIADVKRMRYKVNIPTYDCIGFTDPDKLEKIIYNLLSNAFKFTPEDGTVIIAVSFLDRQLEIRVTDNGTGIAKSHQDTIFDRFYQVDASQTRSTEGSGIGLSLTKELTELLGGKISLCSEPGNGCEFIVTLPMLTGTETPDIEVIQLEATSYYPYVEQNEISHLLGPEENTEFPVVLIIDDNLDFQKYMRSCLAAKYNVLLAPHGEAGLAVARQRIPDLIISDIMMPVMDGVTLLRELRSDEKTSHIPIILLTASVDGETKIKGFETGADQYLVKPFEIDELHARIQSLLTRQETLRKKYVREISLQPTGLVIKDRDATFLEKAVRIIEENMTSQSFTVETLQLEVGMSRMQLHRKLKALINQPASDFIRSIKLKRAAQLLKQPGMQIAEVAFLSGFHHRSNFSKCFKEHFGMLPSEFVRNA